MRAPRRCTLTVVPVTSTLEPELAFHVLLPAESSGLERDSKAQAEHVRSVDVRRFVHPVGHLPVSKMLAIDAALRLHLDLG
jgi:mRNA interferase MazF